MMVPAPVLDAVGWGQAVLAWGAASGRRGLPWQPSATAPADPYRVWLSEVMLQQTQVTTVLPAFQRFLLRFPTVERLAAAEQQEVLGVWTGLGYYARARNLHRAAQQIIESGWPTSADGLAQLPGIGRSTAAAIASVVWQERAAILDGNVKRLMARVVAAPEPWNSPALARHLWPLAEGLLPETSQMPLYTQTLMDLGATVCRPRAPDCQRCPVERFCQAARLGDPTRFPVKAQKTERGAAEVYWCLPLESGPPGGRPEAIWLVRRPSTGIWAGLWTPPEPTGSCEGMSLIASGQIRQELTHRSLTIHWEVVDAAEWCPPNAQRWRLADLLPNEGGWQAGLPRPLVEVLQHLLMPDING